MTEEEYPGPRIIETSAPCPTLARLPKLPVRVLILSAGGDDGAEGRGLASRLVRLADELGVGTGVQVQERHAAHWDALFEDHERERWDGVFVAESDLPASYDDPSEPTDGLIDSLSLLLADSDTRFLVLQPPHEGEFDRRNALCLRLAERGSPPAVVVPATWGDGEADAFADALLERILHDAPLVAAVSDAAEPRLPPPTIFKPPGRRHGLDLGRLLEDHRRRIEEGAIALRMFLRELQAVRGDGDPDPRGVALAEGAEAQQVELEGVKSAVEEINRDRDPAGWSRLADSIARLQRWEDELEGARHALEATRNPPG